MQKRGSVSENAKKGFYNLFRKITIYISFIVGFGLILSSGSFTGAVVGTNGTASINTYAGLVLLVLGFLLLGEPRLDRSAVTEDLLDEDNITNKEDLLKLAEKIHSEVKEEKDSAETYSNDNLVTEIPKEEKK